MPDANYFAQVLQVLRGSSIHSGYLQVSVLWCFRVIKGIDVSLSGSPLCFAETSLSLLCLFGFKLCCLLFRFRFEAFLEH